LTYDTDLELLEAVVAAVSAELMADPAIGPEMIEPLRSLGVQAMVDTGMQIGMMFKTRPGRQFAVRRAVFSRIKLAFAARGIRIASTLALQLAQRHGRRSSDPEDQVPEPATAHPYSDAAGA